MSSRRQRTLRRAVRAAKLQAASAPSKDFMVFEAEVDLAATQGDGKLPTFKGTAYTGGRMKPAFFSNDVVVDLDGLEVSSAAKPILLGHQTSQIVGHSTKITTAGKIKVEGIVSGGGDAANQVVTAAKNGFPWKMSIGMSVSKMIFVDEGEKVRINGREFTGPLNVARKGFLGEISFVPLAADGKTSARVAASAHLSEVENMEFAAWLEAKGFGDESSLSETQVLPLRAAWKLECNDGGTTPGEGGDPGKGTVVDPPKDPIKATGEPAKTPAAQEPVAGDVIAQIRAETKAEFDRVAAINKVCAGHEEIKAKAAAEGWDVTRAELEVLRASRPQGPAIQSFGGDKTSEAIEAALLMSAGGASEKQCGEWYGEKVMNAALDSKYRGMGLHATMYETIRAAGMYYPPGQSDNEFIRVAKEADGKLRASNRLEAASGSSTITLTGILSNVANKSLLASFLAVDNILQRIASESDTNDFKQVSSYRMTGIGEFTIVGADGEIKHITVSEETFTNQIDTYAAMIALNRQMMINDDLNAFLLIPRTIGRKSAIKLQKVGFTEFLNNSSFFAAGNNNYFDGAATNLQISSLTTALKIFREQTDANGDPISVNPGTLLVPPALEVTAMQLFQEARVNETTTTNKPSPANNPHVGNYTPVVAPWIGGGQAISGSSDLAWYLLSNTLDIAALEVLYLSGRRVPVLESEESSFNTLGMQWRGYFDFGVSKMEHRAGVKSKGEA